MEGAPTAAAAAAPRLIKGRVDDCAEGRSHAASYVAGAGHAAAATRSLGAAARSRSRCSGGTLRPGEQRQRVKERAIRVVLGEIDDGGRAGEGAQRLAGLQARGEGGGALRCRQAGRNGRLATSGLPVRHPTTLQPRQMAAL